MQLAFPARSFTMKADETVKAYLIARLLCIQRDSLMQEAVLAHLEPAIQTKRFEILRRKIKVITIEAEGE